MAITSYPDKPYFDDINSPDISGLSPLDKNYLRILFRPGVSVQTRELNQIQSLLQSQVDRLGQSIFKANSPILGAECSFESNLNYVDCKLSDSDINDFNSIKENIDELFLSQAVGAGTNLETGTSIATITKIEDLNESEKRIYFQYKSGDFEFNSSETIDIQNDILSLAIPLGVINIGKAVAATLENGIYFAKGCVVSSQKQYTAQPLNPGTTSFSGFVALRVEEKIITSSDDKTLLDNAAGSLNFAARGADRYQIVLTPVLVQAAELPKDADYIQVLKISNSSPIQIQNTLDVSGANLERILARRTYEESGDYIVKEFSVENQEVIGSTYESRYSSPEDLVQFGISSEDADNHFVTTISPGIAYVSGTRVENIGANTLLANKARTTFSDLNLGDFFDASITADLGSYVEGSFVVDSGAPILDSLSSYNLFESVNSQTSIGSCKIQSIEKISDSVFRVYLYDITFNSGKNFKTVTHIRGDYSSYGTFNFSVSSSSAAGLSKLNKQTTNSSLFRWSQPFIKSVTNLNVTQKMYFTATVENTQAVFNTDGVFDKSPSNIILWSNEKIITSPLNIVDGQAGNVLTISGLTNGASIRVLASVTNNITANRGTKTLTTENLTSFKNENGTNVNNTTTVIAPETVLTVNGVYHAISVNDSRFVLIDDGQYPNQYKQAKIKAIVEIPINQNGLTVNVTHWKFSSPGNVATYYTANSYLKPNQNSPVEIKDIPFYDGIRLSDCIDTRVLETETRRLVLDPYSPITSKLDFYLPRRDRLVASNNGQFSFIRGIPSLNPELPSSIDGTLTLFEYNIPAYTLSVKDITIKKINHKRYTMSDIDRIEKRVGTLEYYTSLSLLEKSVKEKGIYDDDGTERFKNGFVTDSFRNYGTVDLINPLFRSSLDRENGRLFPYQSSYNIKFSPVSKTQTGIKIHRSNAMLDYDIVEADEFTQPFATQFISVQPHDTIANVGVLQLYPEVDTWSDRTTTPPISVNLFPGLDDTIAELAENIPGFLGTDWNRRWTTTNIATTRPNRRTVRWDINQVQTGVQTSIVNDNVNASLGQFVSDVSIRPFMRSRSIRLRAAGLKANTTYYFFFDGINVTQYVRPVPRVNGSIPSIADFDLDADEGLDETTLLAKYPSGAIISDANGVVEGIFVVPNNANLRFASGDSTLRVTNSPRNLEDETFSRADARFISNGLGITSSQTNVSTQVPRISVQPVQRNRTLVLQRRVDPVAQTFSIPETGMFMTGVEIYFASKPAVENKAVSVRTYLVEVINGYPTNDIIPGSEVVLSWDGVNISSDSSIATEFNFESPVYLQPNREYAIVVFSESPEYTVYLAELGSDKRDLITGQIINKQPALGVFFTSSNKTTWSAWQNRDLKLKVRRANFKVLDSLIRFKPTIPSGIQEIKISNSNPIVNNVGWSISNTTVSVSAPLNGGITAIASPIFDPNTQAIVGFKIIRAGSGYTSNPVVTITDSSVTPAKTATLNASLFGYAVSSFNLNMKRILSSTASNILATNSSITSRVKLGNKTYDVIENEPVERVLNKNYSINSSTESDNETNIEIRLRSNSNYFSPVIDLDSLSLGVSSYDLNNSKYFTKEIKLTNPADRLDIYLDVNRPTSTSNILVYSRFKDNTGVSTEYQLVPSINPTTIPINSDPDVYSEVKFSIDPPGEFSSFTIRIDFIGVNSDDICTVKDLRAIATL